MGLNLEFVNLQWNFIVFVKTDSIRSILIFNTLESLLMLALIAIPVVFTKVTRFKIPEIMEVLYIIFCAGSIILEKYLIIMENLDGGIHCFIQ